MNEIIHIGFSKNASTWFQKDFFPYIKNVSFIDKALIREKIIDINSFDFDGREISGYFNNNYSGRLLLSHENLVGPLNVSGFNGIATKDIAFRLKSVFPDAEIIIFIRNQAEIISSAYLQEVIEGSTYNIRSFLFPHNKNLFNRMMMFSFAYFEYDKIIKYYYNLFGQSKVHVFLYEDFLTNATGFLNNFASVFNFDVNIPAIINNKNNSRPRKFLIPLVKAANIFTRENTVFKYYLINVPLWFRYSRKLFNYLNRFEIFGDFPSSEMVLGKSNFEYINNYYKKSNNVIYSELGLHSIKDHNYPL